MLWPHQQVWQQKEWLQWHAVIQFVPSKSLLGFLFDQSYIGIDAGGVILQGYRTCFTHFQHGNKGGNHLRTGFVSFEKVLKSLNIPQPQGRAVTKIEDGIAAASVDECGLFLPAHRAFE